VPVSRSGKHKKKRDGQGRRPSGLSVEASKKFVSGEIVPFYEVCPDAGEEMRVMTVRNHPRLPDGDYGLIDGFCADPDCDCRVIYIFVVSESLGKLASITFGWETLEFYRQWMGSDRVDDHIRTLKGPALMSMTPQTEFADALLELVALRLQDSSYVDLLKRHYRQFKDALRPERPSTPDL
jgi:hypothetical protein